MPVAPRYHPARRRFIAAAAGVSLGLLPGCAHTLTAAELPHRRAQARPLAPRGLALVLGSGGPRGFAHIGALQALAQLNIAPDLIVGSSVGAMLGALAAAGRSAAQIEQLALGLTVWDLLDFTPGGLLHGSLYTGRSVGALASRDTQIRTLEALPLPFAAAATQLPERVGVAFDAGDLGLALQASCAIVGTAPPVRIGTQLYCDGDLAAPLPAQLARSLGAQRVIALDVSAWDRDTPDWVRSSRPDWVADAQRRDVLVAAERPAIDLLLRLHLPYIAGFSEGYRRRAIALGREQTLAQADALRRLAA
ncbi:MAG: patatin-like phospholipase family protein [Betaproteobacteria bacterium]|nr:patatin-like phospholipase family protein [Betaproteobacteria bacterium]